MLRKNIIKQAAVLWEITQWGNKPFCSPGEGVDDGVPGGVVTGDCVALFRWVSVHSLLINSGLSSFSWGRNLWIKEQAILELINVII